VREKWGQGFGTDAARVRNRIAFEELGLRLLTSEVFAGNERSLRMLQRAGYVEFGRLPKKHWKRGEFRDAVLLYIDRDMWRDAR
jgi:RimJ/RimL family protein N-acetyltransferase